MAAQPAQESVLSSLGSEVTGVVGPVTLCMAATVTLVRILNPEGLSSADALAIAQVYYTEKADDPASTRFFGSLVNALIFVAFIVVVTFGLVLLFKYNCTRCIYGYLGFAGFTTLFLVVGALAQQLLLRAAIPIDYFSLAFILWNFAVVGALGLMQWRLPVTVQQGYLIMMSVCAAFSFTFVPEWTTWLLLGAMSAYDVVAVLVPGGPLKILVELAQERNEDIPALVYETRKPVQPPAAPRIQRRPQRRAQAGAEAQEGSQEGAEPGPSDGDAASPQGADAHPHRGVTADLARGRLLEDDLEAGVRPKAHRGQSGRDSRSEGDGGESERLLSSAAASSSSEAAAAESSAADRGSPAHQEHPLAPPAASQASSHQGPEPQSGPWDRQRNTSVVGEDEDELPDSIKLGLGDFIFYSLLVGRAAMYDLLTVYAAYLAIIAGLGITLLLLCVQHQALPALPISITLGIAFYFAARHLLEPFMLGLSTNLLYY